MRGPERKKSEITEQGLLLSQGREEAQGQRSQEEPTVLRETDQCLQPRQDGVRPTPRGQKAHPAAHRAPRLGEVLRQGLASLLPTLPWLGNHTS